MSILKNTLDRLRTSPPTWPGLTLFALTYLGCAEAGHYLSFRPEAFATFWPASGLMLTALVVYPVRVWPRLVTASLAANLVSDLLLHGRSLPLGLAFGIGNAAEACVGAALLRRFADGPFRCSTPQQVLLLMTPAALLGATISATIGTAAMSLAGVAGYSWNSWRMWWGSDVLGILVVAPLLLVRGGGRVGASPGRQAIRLAEFGLVLVALLTLAGFAFTAASPPEGAIWRLPYLYTVPFLLWNGVRFGQRAGAITALALTLLVAWNTTRGRGPFTFLTASQAERSLLLHIFLSSVLITSLILTSAIAALKASQECLRRNEEALRTLSTLQRAILDAANYSIISTDSEGIIRTFNAAAERWLGHRADEVVGKVTPALIHDPVEVAARAAELSRELGRPVAPGFEAFVARAQHGDTDEREWTYVRRDGGRFPVRLSVTLLRGPEGRGTGFLGIGSDITREKAAREELRRAHDELEDRVARRTEELARANELLREGERKFRQLADAMPQIVWAARPDGYLDYYNDRWYEFTGFTREVSGDESWTPILHPDDIQLCVATWYRAVATGEPYEIQYRFRDRKTGRYRWHLGRALPVRDEVGRIVRWFGTSTDIDDLRRAEEDRQHLATIVESSGDAIISKDLEGVITYWNVGAERLFGYTAAEAVGRSILFLIPEGREPEEAEILERLRKGEQVRHYESVRRTKGGRLIDVSLTISPIKDASGRMVGISKIARDITDKKEAESAIRALNADLERRVESRTADLARAKEAAEAASRAKGEFLANMSHEIRTPMNGILGMTELLLDTTLTGRQREYLDLVKSSADALLEVIDEILDFSKIEAGMLSVVPSPFRPRELVTTTLRTLNVRAHEKGLVLACRIGPEVPESVVGDAGRLRQVLVNLVGNAIKFTMSGEVVVTVDAQSGAEGDVEVLCSVADTGIGIPPEKRPAIFAPFEQGDGSTTRRFGGTGLGLTISSRLIALMGGKIWIEDNPGGGTIFRFTTRLARDPATGEDHSMTAAASVAGGRVLVVDDNRTNRMILQELLRRWEISAFVVEGATEALEVLDAAERAGDPIDAVLLDQVMTGGSGLDLAGRIRLDPRFARTGILMLSSVGPSDDAGPIRDLRIGGILLKPVHPSELHDALARILAGRLGPEPDRAGPNREAVAIESRLRILLVEDHRVNQVLAMRLLGQMGHEVVVAGDGRAALEALKDGHFDLVLMDVQMPEMDGFEAVAEIRAREAGSSKHTRIVALTAHAMNGDRERCLAAGFDDYLAKPIRQEKLREVLQTHKPPGTDPIERLHEQCRGDRPFARELASCFLESAPGCLAGLEAALGRGDPSAVASEAHGLKGISATIGADELAQACLAVEQAARRRRLDLAWAEGLPAVQRQWERLRAAFESFV